MTPEQRLHLADVLLDLCNIAVGESNDGGSWGRGTRTRTTHKPRRQQRKLSARDIFDTVRIIEGIVA